MTDNTQAILDAIERKIAEGKTKHEAMNEVLLENKSE
jgi:hypothetical protein